MEEKYFISWSSTFMEPCVFDWVILKLRVDLNLLQHFKEFNSTIDLYTFQAMPWWSVKSIDKLLVENLSLYCCYNHNLKQIMEINR